MRLKKLHKGIQSIILKYVWDLNIAKVNEEYHELYRYQEGIVYEGKDHRRTIEHNYSSLRRTLDGCQIYNHLYMLFNSRKHFLYCHMSSLKKKKNGTYSFYKEWLDLPAR